VKKHKSTPPVILVFAASDPVCGAGIQADLLTIARLGGHPATVLTALTVQDTTGVTHCVPVPAAFVREQAVAVLGDMRVAAYKIGVLGSVENATTVARLLADHPGPPVVFDPVLASGRGDVFADAELRAVFRAELLPLTALLTPNLPEAQMLQSCRPQDCRPQDRCPQDRQALADGLLALGARHVLLTGTHDATTDVVNTLHGQDGLLREDRWRRLPGSYHGSGCTLASAIAADLAHGMALEAAVHEAQAYTWQTLLHGYRPGKGQSIPQRLFGWEDLSGSAHKFPSP
jgi:hydroxymethylpyrimidine/phosphomethylpyrimidine kinase